MKQDKATTTKKQKKQKDIIRTKPKDKDKIEIPEYDDNSKTFEHVVSQIWNDKNIPDDVVIEPVCYDDKFRGLRFSTESAYGVKIIRKIHAVWNKKREIYTISRNSVKNRYKAIKRVRRIGELRADERKMREEANIDGKRVRLRGRKLGTGDTRYILDIRGLNEKQVIDINEAINEITTELAS